ncbi:MAG: HlyD family efflux transporter periplasmic adaptor subunit [Planctomycetota bacterium]
MKTKLSSRATALSGLLFTATLMIPAMSIQAQEGGSFTGQTLPPSTYRGTSQGAATGSESSPFLSPAESDQEAGEDGSFRNRPPFVRDAPQSNLPGSVPPSSGVTGGSFSSTQPRTNAPANTGFAPPPSSSFNSTTVSTSGVQQEGAGPGTVSGGSTANECTIEECKVELIMDIEVPARATGPLSEMNVELNQLVSETEQVAKVDDQEATRILEQATLKYDMARTISQDRTAIEMAENKVKLATTEYRVNYNLYKKRSKTRQEALRSQYSMQIAELEEVDARNQFEIARMEAAAELVNVHAARETVERHQILSPVNGVVLERFRERGEWVNRGDKVLRIAPLDRLYVRGVVSADNYVPSVFDNKLVVVTSRLGGRNIEFQGRVVRTDLEQQGLNEYGVVVEVINQRDATGHWMLLPGAFVNGRILLDRNAPEQSALGAPEGDNVQR